MIPSDVSVTVGEKPGAKLGKGLPNASNHTLPKSKERGLGARNDRPSH